MNGMPLQESPGVPVSPDCVHSPVGVDTCLGPPLMLDSYSTPMG